MTAIADRREPLFPKRTLLEQIAFAAMIWAGFTLFIFVLTFAVSLVREIDVSGWNLGLQPTRWFVFVIGIYLGWSALPLHLTHGGTRKGFMTQVLGFSLLYVPALAAMVAISFALEAGYYGMMGWPQVLHGTELYAHALNWVPVFVQWFAIFGVWLWGGILIGTAWYRNTVLGALCIPLGLMAVSVSSLSISGEVGPMSWMRQLFPAEPGMLAVIVAHLLLIALFAGLSWLAMREIPVRNKSETAG